MTIAPTPVTPDTANARPRIRIPVVLVDDHPAVIGALANRSTTSMRVVAEPRCAAEALRQPECLDRAQESVAHQLIAAERQQRPYRVRGLQSRMPAGADRPENESVRRRLCATEASTVT